MRDRTRIPHILQFVTIFTLFACSGSGEQPHAAKTPSERNDGEAVHATLGVEGGTITAVGADGTRFTLKVPPYALWSATEITLTPLGSVDQLPLGAGALAAVEFAPDGLRFLAPAELTMVAGQFFDPAWLVGFTKSGDQFALQPVGYGGDTLRMVVGHFSSAGAGTSSEEETNALNPANASGAEQQANHELAAYFAQEAAAGRNPEPARAAEILKGWYDGSVSSGLDAAVSGAGSTLDAVAEYLRWAAAVGLSGADAWLERDLAEGLSKSGAAIKAEIARLNERCAAENNWQLAVEILNWAATAGAMGLDEIVPGLDRASILENLCIQVVIEELSFLEELKEGRESPLRVRAGMSIGGRSPRDLGPIEIQIDPTDTAQVAPSAGSTDQAGDFSASVKPLVEAGEKVVLDVMARFPEIPGLHTTKRIEEVVGESVKVQVSPAEVTLEPAETRQFSAMVIGADDDTVIWSATGGTISEEGLYEAGKDPGTFTVTATSVVDPEAEATALVQIEGTPMVTPLLNVRSSYSSRSSVYVGQEIHQPAEGALFESYELSTSSDTREAALSGRYSYDSDTGTLSSIELQALMHNPSQGAAWGSASFRLLFQNTAQKIRVRIKGTCWVEGNTSTLTNNGRLSLRIDDEPGRNTGEFMRRAAYHADYYKNDPSRNPCADMYEIVSDEIPPGIYRLEIIPYEVRNVDYDFELTFEPIPS